MCQGAWGAVTESVGGGLLPWPCTQPGGACALQGPCLPPATPSHLPAWLPPRPPSAGSRASPGCSAYTAGMFRGVGGGLELRCVQIQGGPGQTECVSVCVCVCNWVCIRVSPTRCVCVYSPLPRALKGELPPPILVMALLFRCPSWGGGSWGSPADRGRKRMTLSAHQRMWAGGAGCLCKRGELCTCRTPASPVAPAHLGAPRARDERCQGVPPSRRGSHRAGW